MAPMLLISSPRRLFFAIKYRSNTRNLRPFRYTSEEDSKENVNSPNLLVLNCPNKDVQRLELEINPYSFPERKLYLNDLIRAALCK